MYRTDEPIRDFEQHDAEQQRRRRRLPRCCECDEPIQDDDCFEINGELICPGCLKDNHQKRTADYIEEA